MQRHLRGAECFGAPLRAEEGSGVFDAELQAIVRVLLVVPVQRNVIIYSDSRSSIDAINAWQTEVRCRSRLRMAGRPLLRISCLRAKHAKAHSSVTFEWVRAHSDTVSLAHAGNRIADFTAKRFAQRGARIDSRIA